MSVNVFLSDAELAALADFLPRVQVANVCREGAPLHTALLKVAPTSLPTSLRYAEDGWDRSKKRPDGTPVYDCKACAIKYGGR